MPCSRHNAVLPVRLEPATPQSQVKHSTTEPLHSPDLGLCCLNATVRVSLDMAHFI